MKRRSPRHYARNTALATLGLYAILMLVVLSLVAGAESARNATPDNDTATTFSNQIGQALPGLLGVEQSTRRLNAGFFPGKQHEKANTEILIVAALAILTNGYSLLGLAQGSAGALARTIECNQAMVRALAANLALKLQSGTPPARPQRWIPERFILDCPA